MAIKNKSLFQSPLYSGGKGTPLMPGGRLPGSGIQNWIVDQGTRNHINSSNRQFSDKYGGTPKQYAPTPMPYPGGGASATPPAYALPNRRASGPSLNELRRYSDLQVRSTYRPKLSELERQIGAANAMGMQSQAAIGGWGQAAGQEIAGAGRRNFKEVQGIQGNLGGMLAAIGGASGNMGTKQNNRAYLGAAAAGAGMISGLGAADQGWFNRARDVNAQTTNFYRNNARDQYAQQAYELQQQRNDVAASEAEARAAGRIQAKQTLFDNQQSGQSSNSDRLGGAQAQFYDEIANGTPVADAARIYGAYLSDPEEIARYNAFTRLYRGGAGTAENQRLLIARKAADRAAGATK